MVVNSVFTGEEPCVTECESEVRRDVDAEAVLKALLWKALLPWPGCPGACAHGLCQQVCVVRLRRGTAGLLLHETCALRHALGWRA